jgi:hypothetical protein
VPPYRWTPTTPEQKAAVAAVRRSAARLTRAEQAVAGLEAELWAAVQAARKVGAPARYMAKEAKRGRATLYRHIPGSKPEPESGDE